MPDNVIEFSTVVAVCADPDCESTEFHLLLNGFNDNWTKVVGTKCAVCGHTMTWVRAEKEEKST
jgi:hypothetical protein